MVITTSIPTWNAHEMNIMRISNWMKNVGNRVWHKPVEKVIRDRRVTGIIIIIRRRRRRRRKEEEDERGIDTALAHPGLLRYIPFCIKCYVIKQ